ncbi:MAG TPA: PTS sugar transporter subunit IIA [Pirellulaceae bacterium]|nr:PTS sugar transporter subunit IIA [Pirellulaceae bacterium]
METFTLEQVAVYLHLTPAQTLRLAERGKLPGRKVSSEWRFTDEQIHDWLEERLGLSAVEDLAEVEAVLERRHPAMEEPKLASLAPEAATAIPLDARTRRSVVDAMATLAAQTGWLWDPDAMTAALLERETLHSTALDVGVAFLHPRRPMPHILGDTFLAFGRTPQGIPFGGPRGALTDCFFLILALDDAVHLKILARLSRLVVDPACLAGLRSASSHAELIELLREFDERDA